MADIRSNGIFGDQKSGGGLFRGATVTNSTSDVEIHKVGSPIDVISRRESATLFHDFIDNNDVLQYVVTNITSGTAVTDANSVNGALQLTATTDNQGLGSVQFDDASVDNAAAFITAAADRIITFEVGVTLGADLSVFDWFIGLGEVDTTFMLATGALAANGGDNHIGFHHLVADAGDPAFSSAGVAVANVERTAFSAGVNHEGGSISSTISDATYTRLGFRLVNLNRVEFYVDGELGHVREMADDLAEPMTPTFCLIADGTARTMDIDYLLITQTR